MKKALVFVFLLLAFLASPSHAANFVEVISDEDFLVYIDIDSIESRKDYGDEYIVSWVRMIPQDEMGKKLKKEYRSDVERIMTFAAFAPKRKQYQELRVIIYGPKGKVIEDNSMLFFSARYEEIVPESRGETIYNFVISHYTKNRKKR